MSCFAVIYLELNVGVMHGNLKTQTLMMAIGII